MFSSSSALRFAICFSILFLIWLILLALSVCVGSYKISLEQILTIIGQMLQLVPAASVQDDNAYLIITQLRLSRSCLALLCGGALASAGAILQGVLRNPLADPFTLGVSAGAACGASLALVFPTDFTLFSIKQNSLTSLAAFSGAMAALFACLILGRSKGAYVKENIILAGIAISTFLAAIVALIKALNEESVTSIVFWIMGSLQGRGWEALPLILASMLPVFLSLILGWRKLDILTLGDEQARLLGLSPGWTRFWLLCCASFMTSSCVAICGIIAFVGLVIPHIARLLWGASHGPLLLASFFGGGIFLLIADCISRIILDGGQELPVGVVTALTGGPFFAFLIWKRK